MQQIPSRSGKAGQSDPNPAQPGRRPTRIGLRLWLMLLAAALTLPLLGVAIAGLLRDDDNARRRSEEQLVMQARSFAITIDSQMATAAAVARTLANSDSLSRGDLVSFRREMDAAAAGLVGAQITLADRHPSMLLITRLPPGEAPPPGTAAPGAALALAAGRETISDLFLSPVGPRSVLAVTALVPPQPDAAITAPGTVSVILSADYFTPLLQAQASAPGWIAALADRQLRIVSRSEDAERYAYERSVPTAVAAALQDSQTGVARFLRPEGTLAVAGFARAPASGYVAVIGRPAADIDKAGRQSMIQTLAVSVPLVLFGFGLALLLSDRITRAIDALASPTARGPSGLPFREVERIAERLTSAERWRTVLMQEMNHRVKNTLATVQAVAAQTLRGAEEDPASFGRLFLARLSALGRAHDLLMSAAGGGAPVSTTVRAGLAPWLQANSNALQLTVAEDFQVSERQAQALILALHELGTNAVKYGALSHPGGTVVVSCSIGEGGLAELTWLEAGGPPITDAPTRRGFGSRLLEVVLPQDLGPDAAVTRDFNFSGLRASIRFRHHVRTS